MIFYDTHAHLGFPDFAGDLTEVVARAQAAGIARIITIGTDLEGSRRAIEIAEQFPSVFAGVGTGGGAGMVAVPTIRRRTAGLTPLLTSTKSPRCL